MNETTNNTYTSEQMSDMIIQVITEDPSKIIEAMNDADRMIEFGADEGMTQHELMAEYIVYAFKKANANVPHMTDLYNSVVLHEETIENAIIAHLASIQK